MVEWTGSLRKFDDLYLHHREDRLRQGSALGIHLGGDLQQPAGLSPSSRAQKISTSSWSRTTKSTGSGPWRPADGSVTG